MSQATVFSSSQYGLVTDVTATGLYLGSLTYSSTSDLATVPNHIGCDVGFAIYNAKKEVSIDGVIAAKGTAMPADIGEVVTLANSTNNTRTRQSENLGETPVAGAAIVVTGSTLTLSNTGFEQGSITAIYYPSVSTSAPVTLT